MNNIGSLLPIPKKKEQDAWEFESSMSQFFRTLCTSPASPITHKHSTTQSTNTHIRTTTQFDFFHWRLREKDKL